MSRVDLHYLTAAKASGEDAGDFLQGQLTADLTKLSDGDACYSGYCDPKGNVLALLRVIRHGNEYVLIAANELMDLVLGELGKYVMRARVSLDKLDDRVGGVLEGDDLVYVLESGDSPDGAGDAGPLDEWRARELQKGVAWLGEETSGRFLPQMLGLENIGALSFRKGCFPGQEVIARVRYLGKLKREPLIVQTRGRLDAAPGSDATLFSEDGEAGTAVVVDGAPSDDGTVIFLVARVPGDAVADAVEIGEVRRPLALRVQTWATM